MTPALGALSSSGSAMPLRVGYVYSPNGIITEAWRPAIAGANFEMTQLLEPFAPVLHVGARGDEPGVVAPTAAGGAVVWCATGALEFRRVVVVPPNRTA